MTFLDDYASLAKSPLFWILLGICVLGVAFMIFLIYKSKDKLVSMIISIPFSFLTMWVITLMVSPLLVNLTEIVGSLVRGSISAMTFSMVYWVIRKYLVKIIRKVFQFNIVKGQ